MKLRLAISLVAGSLIAAATNAQDSKKLTIGAQPTVDELVANNIEAKGGAAALAALKSVRLQGKLLLNEGRFQLAYLEFKKRPNEVRTEATLQGMTQVQAYDGVQAWQISPFRGRKDPEKMSEDDTKSLIQESEIDGPLVNWKEKGSTVEYLGTEDVDGTEAYKLKVTRKNGDISYVFLDPDYFLEIRVLTQRMEHGAQVETETDLSDYEKINGVFLPFSLESGPKGSQDKQKLILDNVEGNVSIDDSIFHFPTHPSK